MEENSYKDLLEKKDVKIKDLIRRSGVFKTEDGKEIKWKSYVLKMNVEGIIMTFKLDKVFNDTLEEILGM